MKQASSLSHWRTATYGERMKAIEKGRNLINDMQSSVRELKAASHRSKVFALTLRSDEVTEPPEIARLEKDVRKYRSLLHMLTPSETILNHCGWQLEHYFWQQYPLTKDSKLRVVDPMYDDDGSRSHYNVVIEQREFNPVSFSHSDPNELLSSGLLDHQIDYRTVNFHRHLLGNQGQVRAMYYEDIDTLFIVNEKIEKDKR